MKKKSPMSINEAQNRLQFMNTAQRKKWNSLWVDEPEKSHSTLYKSLGNIEVEQGILKKTDKCWKYEVFSVTVEVAPDWNTFVKRRLAGKGNLGLSNPKKDLEKYIKNKDLGPHIVFVKDAQN